jgi:hypothetical protein
MDSDELLDRIAQQGLFGKKYKNFESAPAEAQRVIRFVAKSSPSLSLDSDALLSARPASPPRRPFNDARLIKLEASVARIERAIAHLTKGMERLEQLDVIASATRIKMDRSRKVRAGIARAQREGRQFGRPRRDFALDEAVALRAQGMSLRKIAIKMGIPHMTIANGLKRVRIVVQKNAENDVPNR